MKPIKLFCLILASILFVGTGCKQKPTNVKSTLHHAARIGDIQKMQKLISDGHEINVRDKDGDTPLHIASHNGHTKIVKLLLTNGADVDTKDKRGRTPLHYAAGAGHMKIVKIFLNNGAEVNAISEGFTPLHWAADEGHKDVVELLLDNGADINGDDVNGDTALSRATLNGHRDIAELLLAKGADVTAGCMGKYISIQDTEGKNLHELAEYLVREYGPYSIIVANIESIRQLLRYWRIDFEGIWVPEQADLEGLDDALRFHLQNAKTIKAKPHFNRKFILTYFNQYSREYSGITRGDNKYIICQMILPRHFPVEPPDNKFTMIHGFANGVVRVVFELKSKKVVEIDCEYWM